MTGYISSAIDQVNACTTVADVEAISVTSVEVQCEGVKTLVEELADAKAAKVTALNALQVYTETDYSPENWIELTGYISSAIDQVNACTTILEVEAISVTSVEAQCEEVKTLAEELADAKAIRINELNTLQGTYTEANYSPENWSTLTDYINTAIGNVEACTTVAQVEAITVTSVEAQCDAVPTI